MVIDLNLIDTNTIEFSADNTSVVVGAAILVRSNFKIFFFAKFIFQFFIKR